MATPAQNQKALNPAITIIGMFLHIHLNVNSDSAAQSAIHSQYARSFALRHASVSQRIVIYASECLSRTTSIVNLQWLKYIVSISKMLCVREKAKERESP